MKLTKNNVNQSFQFMLDLSTNHGHKGFKLLACCLICLILGAFLQSQSFDSQSQSPAAEGHCVLVLLQFFAIVISDSLLVISGASIALLVLFVLSTVHQVEPMSTSAGNARDERPSQASTGTQSASALPNTTGSENTAMRSANLSPPRSASSNSVLAALIGMGLDVPVGSTLSKKLTTKDLFNQVTKLAKGSKPSNSDLPKNKGSTSIVWFCMENEVLRLHMLLPASRYRILSAQSAEQTLSLLEHLPSLPDVLLLDCELPNGEASLKVLEMVRAEHGMADLPVIALLAVEQQREVGTRCLAAGANDYIAKPMDPAELDARIQAQVQLRQAHTLRVEAQTFVRSLRTFAPPHLLHRAASRQHNCRAVIAQQLPEVTVLFAGVRDFSTLTGRWSAEHAISVLNELFNPFDDLVAKHGCFKADQSGGAYMVVAGHDGARDHALRATRLAAAMLAHATSNTFCGERLQLSVGLHCGPVHCGVVGVTNPRLALFGDTVVTAISLQSRGLPGCALMSAAAQQRLREQASPADNLACVDVGMRHLRGKGPMSVYLAKVGEWEAALRAMDMLHAASSGPPSRKNPSSTNSDPNTSTSSHPHMAHGVPAAMYQEMAGLMGPLVAGGKGSWDSAPANESGAATTGELRHLLDEALPAQMLAALAAGKATVAGSQAAPTASQGSRGCPTLTAIAEDTSGTKRAAEPPHSPQQGATQQQQQNQNEGRSISRTSSFANITAMAAEAGVLMTRLSTGELTALETVNLSRSQTSTLGAPTLGLGIGPGVGSTSGSMPNANSAMIVSNISAAQAPVSLGPNGVGQGSLSHHGPAPLSPPTSYHHTSSGLRHRTSFTDTHTSHNHQSSFRNTYASTSSGVTLPMSSDSSLYRIPWMEQYIGVAGGLGNAGSGSAQAGSNGVRGDSDEGLERSFPISGVDLVSYLERFSTHASTVDHQSSVLDARSNNILWADRLTAGSQEQGSGSGMGSSTTAVRSLMGYSTAQIAALRAHLVATAGTGNSLISPETLMAVLAAAGNTSPDPTSNVMVTAPASTSNSLFMRSVSDPRGSRHSAHRTDSNLSASVSKAGPHMHIMQYDARTSSGTESVPTGVQVGHTQSTNTTGAGNLRRSVEGVSERNHSSGGSSLLEPTVAAVAFEKAIDGATPGVQEGQDGMEDGVGKEEQRLQGFTHSRDVSPPPGSLKGTGHRGPSRSSSIARARASIDYLASALAASVNRGSADAGRSAKTEAFALSALSALRASLAAGGSTGGVAVASDDLMRMLTLSRLAGYTVQASNADASLVGESQGGNPVTLTPDEHALVMQLLNMPGSVAGASNPPPSMSFPLLAHGDGNPTAQLHMGSARATQGDGGRGSGAGMSQQDADNALLAEYAGLLLLGLSHAQGSQGPPSSSVGPQAELLRQLDALHSQGSQQTSPARRRPGSYLASSPASAAFARGPTPGQSISLQQLLTAATESASQSGHSQGGHPGGASNVSRLANASPASRPMSSPPHGSHHAAHRNTMQPSHGPQPMLQHSAGHTAAPPSTGLQHSDAVAQVHQANKHAPTSFTRAAEATQAMAALMAARGSGSGQRRRSSMGGGQLHESQQSHLQGRGSGVRFAETSQVMTLGNITHAKLRDEGAEGALSSQSIDGAELLRAHQGIPGEIDRSDLSAESVQRSTRSATAPARRLGKFMSLSERHKRASGVGHSEEITSPSRLSLSGHSAAAAPSSSGRQQAGLRKFASGFRRVFTKDRKSGDKERDKKEKDGHGSEEHSSSSLGNSFARALNVFTKADTPDSPRQPPPSRAKSHSHLVLDSKAEALLSEDQTVFSKFRPGSTGAPG